MDKEVWLVIAGGAIGLISSGVITVLNSLLEGRRLIRKRQHELQDRRREHDLAVLQEKYEPAIELMAAAIKVVETCDTAEEAHKELKALQGQQSYWVVSARLTNDQADNCLSMVIRYARIRESEDMRREYKAKLINATSELNRLYDKERERLFEQED